MLKNETKQNKTLNHILQNGWNGGFYLNKEKNLNRQVQCYKDTLPDNNDYLIQNFAMNKIRKFGKTSQAYF